MCTIAPKYFHDFVPSSKLENDSKEKNESNPKAGLASEISLDEDENLRPKEKIQQKPEFFADEFNELLCETATELGEKEDVPVKNSESISPEKKSPEEQKSGEKNTDKSTDNRSFDEKASKEQQSSFVKDPSFNALPKKQKTSSEKVTRRKNPTRRTAKKKHKLYLETDVKRYFYI